MRSPVDRDRDEGDRHIAARISEFSGVGPLLAQTDLIATLPAEIMAWDMEVHGLVPLPPVRMVPPFRARFFWSSRVASDPAIVWLRDLVLSAYRDAQAEAKARVAARLGVESTR